MGSSNSNSAYYDSDYARVEMLRLKPKQNASFSNQVQNSLSARKEKKELSPPVDRQTSQYNFVETESYNPRKYDYSNILFKETASLSKKDSNYIKQTSFKGLPSAECKFFLVKKNNFI